MAWKSKWVSVLWACAWLCASCSTEARLRVGGATPYVRCMAGPEPAERTLRLGGAQVRVHGRQVELTGVPADPTLVAFSGPGFGGPPPAAALAELARAKADAVFMLGGLGESEPEARATAIALAKIDRPVFFLAGGRDRWSVLRAALGSSERIVDVTPATELRLGSHTLVFVPGAEAGRYAIDDTACGFGAPDLRALAAALGPPKGSRWLVSWHAPAAARGQKGVTRTATGVDIGSWTLSRFASQIGAPNGFYGWPVSSDSDSVSGPGGAAQRVVPRLWGPRIERDDGSLAPLGFARFTLSDPAFPHR